MEKKFIPVSADVHVSILVLLDIGQSCTQPRLTVSGSPVSILVLLDIGQSFCLGNQI